VANGAGLQSMVAFVNLGSYYLIGLPAGILLGFVAHLNVQVIMSTKLYGLSTLISRALSTLCCLRLEKKSIP